jgi:hypothetical protein
MRLYPGAQVGSDPHLSPGAFGTMIQENLCSGNYIIMKIEDPKIFLLPFWDTLEMQWFLQRAANISGACGCLLQQ